MNKHIQAYIDLVRSGVTAMCREQFQLADLIEKAFAEETLIVDDDQLERYMGLLRYFPYKLLLWESFLFALHNCVYTTEGDLRWPNLVIVVGRGAGKNGYLAFEDFALLTPINGVRNYDIDIFATAEDQARATFDDIWDILESNKEYFKKYFTWTKEEIVNKKTNSALRFRTSSPKTKDGGRPGKVDFDEFHAYENSKLEDVAVTGLGKK
jgi:phage terminase large subunit-like protein